MIAFPDPVDANSIGPFAEWKTRTVRSPITYNLAHLNVAMHREALDHPCMADFVAQLGPVNGLARVSPGFVWMPEGEEAWPVMVLAIAVCFYRRFRNGKWKTMRVIER